MKITESDRAEHSNKMQNEKVCECDRKSECEMIPDCGPHEVEYRTRPKVKINGPEVKSFESGIAECDHRADLGNEPKPTIVKISECDSVAECEIKVTDRVSKITHVNPSKTKPRTSHKKGNLGVAKITSFWPKKSRIEGTQSGLIPNTLCSEKLGPKNRPDAPPKKDIKVSKQKEIEPITIKTTVTAAKVVVDNCGRLKSKNYHPGIAQKPSKNSKIGHNKKSENLKNIGAVNTISSEELRIERSAENAKNSWKKIMEKMNAQKK